MGDFFLLVWSYVIWESPVPGSEAVRRRPRLERLSRNPLGPREVERPVLERLILRPGMICLDLWKRMGKISSD